MAKKQPQQPPVVTPETGTLVDASLNPNQAPSGDQQPPVDTNTDDDPNAPETPKDDVQKGETTEASNDFVLIIGSHTTDLHLLFDAALSTLTSEDAKAILLADLEHLSECPSTTEEFLKYVLGIYAVHMADMMKPAPQPPVVNAGKFDEVYPPTFRDVLHAILPICEDPDEKAAIDELLAILERYPEQDAALGEMAKKTLAKQLAYAVVNGFQELPRTLTVTAAPEFSPSHNTLEADLTDERVERIRANATAELDRLKDESIKRVEAALATASEAQPDRRPDA